MHSKALTCSKVVAYSGAVVLQTTSAEFWQQRHSNESAAESVHWRSPTPAGDLHRLALPEPAVVARRRRRRRRDADLARLRGGPADDGPAAAHAARRTDALPLEHVQST